MTRKELKDRIEALATESKECGEFDTACILSALRGALSEGTESALADTAVRFSKEALKRPQAQRN